LNAGTPGTSQSAPWTNGTSGDYGGWQAIARAPGLYGPTGKK